MSGPCTIRPDSLDLSHVAAVVMDAMPIEGERGITKQQHVVRNPLALPRVVLWRELRRGLDVCGFHCLTVHNVMEFGERCISLGLPTDLVRTFTNTSRPVRSLFSVSPVSSTHA
jgi:hypothetical protein